MTCKDCIKEDVCYKKPVHKLDIELNELGGCSSFKNKADFVEVVRCGKCKHSNDDGTICRYSVGRAVEPDHFCSYGERK